MKEDIHPPYQDILFVDTATGDRFICGSTLRPEESETHEGKEYPVYRVPISSASHPFFTGSQQFVDAEGRVDKFKKRYARRQAAGVKEDKKEEQPKKKTAKKSVKKTAAKKTTTKKKSGE
ncbi:MAG: type B 50S ribosomal protein L31 [Chlamydiota bacterium]